MKIRLLKSMLVLAHWREAGDVLDLEEGRARFLIDHKHAEKVKPPAPDPVNHDPIETATIKTGGIETADKKFNRK